MAYTPRHPILQRIDGKWPRGPMHKPKIRAMLLFLGDENGQSKSWFKVSRSAFKAARRDRKGSTPKSGSIAEPAFEAGWRNRQRAQTKLHDKAERCRSNIAINKVTPGLAEERTPSGCERSSRLARSSTTLPFTNQRLPQSFPEESKEAPQEVSTLTAPLPLARLVPSSIA